MANRSITEAEVYQMFVLASQGQSHTETSIAVRCSRACVAYHLAGRYRHLYSDRLKRRLSYLAFEKPRKRSTDGWLRPDVASYFFPHRPSEVIVYQYMNKGLESSIVSGVRVTRPEWIRRFVENRTQDMPEGILVSKTVLSRLFERPADVLDCAEPVRGYKGIYRYSECKAFSNSLESNATIQKTLSIFDFTGMPFATICHYDF